MRMSSLRRSDLPDSAFALPDIRKYPIQDRKHALVALARVSQRGTPLQQLKVRQAVAKRYPGITKKQSALSAHKARLTHGRPRLTEVKPRVK
jgi:phage-related protein